MGEARTPTAFLVHEETLFFTTVLPPALAVSPWTPITALIEGIWNHAPEQARKILRNRVLTPFPRTALCDGMIKVAAKRADVLSRAAFDQFFFTLSSTLPQIEVHPSTPRLPEMSIITDEADALTFSQAIDTVLALKNNSATHRQRFQSDRSVGALLVSSAGKILGRGWNTNGENRTLHAELNLVRSYTMSTRKLLPINSTLIVSLQPCAMCAAQIHAFSENIEKLKIIYLEKDGGPHSKNSVLVSGSDLWIKAGSPKIDCSLLEKTV